ncbi:hypothetical protein BU24DRAFT_421862 [Aaosphaeria arxii CBS 175.79]|uniref:Uncharacterized protein n=1 Tax=Aaosphaeria arxii CBS 175.79 TaxID=1450172 RepID=A0A6A5XQW3_9PLEO|nr:uncharacterized protein BU24DRAFT_421862 [Aaosphaeria arxii CBS 175.79]KAF2015562.1 hypothetical protein BU24DRAFT_421862 [Aaosphaeria arxii CBS 175.79]
MFSSTRPILSPAHKSTIPTSHVVPLTKDGNDNLSTTSSVFGVVIGVLSLVIAGLQLRRMYQRRRPSEQAFELP